MAGRQPIITLLTDFGLDDHFVGTMKGVILNIHPEVEIVDISHHVPPHDIFKAAFLLRNYYSYFPSGTIHVVVVDPGVGTSRRPVIMSWGKGTLVTPDNGVLSYISMEEEIFEIREITADHYFLKPRTGTFDGRDVFAPVAAWLSKGVKFSAFGEPISDYKILDIPQPEPVTHQQEAWRCKIVSVDHFGNLISNLSRKRFKELLNASKQRRFAFRVAEHTILKISQAYAEGEEGDVIAVFGSSGFLEFSVNQGNAAAVTNLNVGKDFLLKII